MAYTNQNFKTKKALKEFVKSGGKVYLYNPGLGPDLTMFTGTTTVEGPHFPEPHRWYASVEVKDGLVTKVK